MKMELLSGMILGAFTISVLYALYLNFVVPSPENTDREDLAKAHMRIGDYETRIINNVNTIHNLESELDTLRQSFEKLQHQKISADVKLGQKSENLLPFLSTFPYKDDEIRGLFNPIDLIVFRDDEVLFIEVKSGSAQLSEKQRKIRDNIKAGRVRFEIHRMDENGVKIK